MTSINGTSRDRTAASRRSGAACSGGGNCWWLLQAGCHLNGVDSDALGAVVCLVYADQAISELKPGGGGVDRETRRMKGLEGMGMGTCCCEIK